MNQATEALHTAIRDSNIQGVMAALAAGADVRVGNGDALCHAALFGDIGIVDELLAAGVNVHAHRDDALCWAAAYGHIAVVHRLLRAGADIHAKDDAALSWAARDRRDAVVRVLLAGGADPVSALKGAGEDDRGAVAATLDACIDALTSEQRGALLAISRPGEFVRLHAHDISTEKHHTMLR